MPTLLAKEQVRKNERQARVPYMLALEGTTNEYSRLQNPLPSEKNGNEDIYIFILKTAHQLPEAKTDVWNVGPAF